LSAQKVIESGRRNADRFRGELFVVYRSDPDPSFEDKRILEANLAVARQSKAQIERLDAEDPIAAIIGFARARSITQIFIGRGTRKHWWQRPGDDLVDLLIHKADGIDVRVFRKRTVLAV
jgi:K+-sensing histidine kinase KdpD